ncbi:PAS domain S-box protein [Candidatus Latescibacterota bacterium]
MIKKGKKSIDLPTQNFSQIVFNSISESIFIVNFNGEIVNVNKTVEAMFGYTQEELTGEKIEKIVNIPDKTLHRKNCEHFFIKSKKRQMGAALNISACRKDGSDFPVEVGLSSFSVDGDKFVVAIVSDISQRKKIETDLNDNKKKYSAVFDKANDYFVLLDSKGVVIDLNQRALAEIGYSKDEIIGKKLHDLPFLLPNELHKVQHHFLKRFQGKDVGTYELHFVNRNGKILLGEINASIIEFDDGSQVDLVVIRDITERRKLADEIRQSRDYFINLMNSTMDMIIAVDDKRKIVLFNKAAENTFGYKEKEVIGKHINILYAKKPQSIRIHKQLKQTNNFFGEILNKRKNGEIFPSYISSNTLYDDNKNIIGYLGVSRDITESKNADEKLKESEKRWLFALEGSNNGVWDWNIQTDEVFFSVQWKAMLGFEDDEISGSLEEWDKRVHPDDKDQVYKDIQKHMDGETQIYENEHRILCKNGKYIWIHDRGKIMEWTPDGKPLRMVGTQTDITRRKNDEQEKEELLFDFGERVKELNCLYGLAQIANRTDLTMEEMLDNVLYLLPLTWQYPEITCARIKVYDIEKKTDNYEETKWKMSVEITINDEKIGEIDVFYLEERPNLFEGPFLKEERKLLNTVADQVGKIIDHSEHEAERRKLINSLTDKTSELNTILESVGDAIITTDEKYIITSVNRAFCDMFDCASHDYIGKSCEDLFKCDGEPETESCQDHCGLQNTLDNMKAISSRMTVVTDEGKSIVIQSISSPLINSEGNVIGAVKSMRDISREAEVERMKNEFVSTVSHELRTPLTSIKGYIDLFLDGDTGEINEIQQEFLDIVSKNTDRLTALINDLLDIEKIDAGNIALDKQNIGFGKLVEHAFKTVEPLANEKNLRFNISIKDNVKIYANQDRIMQVLTNLLSNAIKFTHKGSVSVSLKKENGNAVLIVKDTGIGVSKADQKKLFTKFFRAKEASKQNIGGTGLGLSIVKSIVELHDGEIYFKSILHKGTEITVELPLAEKVKNK